MRSERINQIDLLLRIVCRVSENTGIDTSPDAVNALDDDTVAICFDKLVVEHQFPDLVHELAPAVGENRRFPCLAFDESGNEVVDGVGELNILGQWTGNQSEKESLTDGK